jgi:hypothetical protein
MDLSTEDLVAALAVTSGQQPDDIAEIVELRAGLLGFGPVTGPRSDETVAVLRERGEHGWVDTPAGRFLLTIGDYVSETAVEDLSAGEGNSNEVNRDEVGDLTA